MSARTCRLGGQFKINAEDVLGEIIWWLKFMEAQVSVEASGDTSEWAIERCEYAPRQADGFNCGIYTIANAVATALGEEDCGEIDPGAWRKWLACEIVAQGWREGTHNEVSLLPLFKCTNIIKPFQSLNKVLSGSGGKGGNKDRAGAKGIAPTRGGLHLHAAPGALIDRARGAGQTSAGCMAPTVSHVFTFSRVEIWVNVSRLSPPAIDRPTEEPLGLFSRFHV